MPLASSLGSDMSISQKNPFEYDFQGKRILIVDDQDINRKGASALVFISLFRQEDE